MEAPPPPPPLRPGARSDDGDQPPGTRRHPRHLLGLRSPPHPVASNFASGTAFTVVPRDGGGCATSSPAMVRSQHLLPSSSPASRSPPASIDASPLSISSRKGKAVDCDGGAPSSSSLVMARPHHRLPSRSRASPAPPPASGDSSRAPRRCPPSDSLPSSSQAAYASSQDSSNLHAMAPPPASRDSSLPSVSFSKVPRCCPPSDNLPSSSQAAYAPSQDASNLHAMGFHNLNWNGPGLHRFHGLENLLLSVGDLNRFFTRREALCILQNAHHFINHGVVNDASDNPFRHDFEFLVVSRRSFLEMAHRAGAFEKTWPGYKDNYCEMSEERRISTLKLNENTFLWRHEVSGKQLLRRRISLDKDEGPFEDESQVFYILQYQKLPRTKRTEKAKILAERGERGYF